MLYNTILYNSIHYNQSEGFPRTGYLIPARDTLLALPGCESCWETAVVAGVTLGYPDGFIQCKYSWIP